MHLNWLNLDLDVAFHFLQNLKMIMTMNRIPLTTLVLLLSIVTFAKAEQRPNVLFIAADDLRNDLGCLGNTEVISPHLDSLAKQGRLFTHAYCQQALCNPSRTSLLTGLRPDTLKIWDLPTHFRQVMPEVVTLPQHFKNNGYFTQNIGKIFHNWRQEIQGDPESWSVPAVMHFANHGSDKPQFDGQLPPDFAQDRKCQCMDLPDEAYFDGRVANLAVEALQERKAADKPFFLAVGFWKPHSPFNAPKKYWDLYDRSQLSMPKNPNWPKDAPEIAWHNSREILGSPRQRQLTPEEIMEIRHGYLAAISYFDAQVGKLLAELERLHLRDNTIVVFWSDHGYHLGEQSLWAKTSNFELDARVPLIISTPNIKNAGQPTAALAELLDLYPTLVELSGLPMPSGLEGTSLAPIIENPSNTVQNAAYTQHPRHAYYEGEPDAMGRSVKTSRFRYTEWRNFQSNELIATELYDHKADPLETVNVANENSYAEAISECKKLYQLGFGK